MECPEPIVVSNAIYSAQAFTIGSIATYQCLPGYSASGMTTEWVFECMENGKWNISFEDIHCDGEIC